MSVCHEPGKVAVGHCLAEASGLGDVGGGEVLLAGKERQDLGGPPGEVSARVGKASSRTKLVAVGQLWARPGNRLSF